MAVPTLTANSPLAGDIAWTAFHIQYNGVPYAVNAGNTANTYVYWLYNGGSPSTTLSVSNTQPTLTADDLLLFLNKNGIPTNLQSVQLIDGDLIVNGTITAAQIEAGTITGSLIAANAIVAGLIAAGAIGTTQLAANAVTAAKIAANTITASQLAAGIVYAGIVDATTITGAQIIADGSNGEILIYPSAPASGNLIDSISGAGGTDGHGNSFKIGIVTYGPNGSYVQLASNGSIPAVILEPQSVTHQTTNPQIFAGAANAGAVNEFNNLTLSSGKNGGDDAAIQLFAESADATVAANAVVEFGGVVFATITKTGLVLPGNATPPVVAGSMSMYATTAGRLQVQDGADGVTYSTERRTYFLGSNTASLGSGFNTIFTAGISTGSYRVHGTLVLTSSSTGAIETAVGLPAGSTCSISYHINRSTVQYAAFNQTAINTLATISSALSAASGFILEVDGFFTMTAGGTSNYLLDLGITAGTFVVQAGSFIDIMPV